MLFEEDILNSVKTLKTDGIILYPTDTVWGLGCDATNDIAIKKIFKIKSRSEDKSLIVLVDNLAMLEKYVTDIPPIAIDLIEVSDSPLTIIYPASRNLSPLVIGDDGTVAIRICKEKFCHALISKLGIPGVSTSANLSGEPAPRNFSEIPERIILAVDYTAEYKRKDRKMHQASPILKVDEAGRIKIIRK